MKLLRFALAAVAALGLFACGGGGGGIGGTGMPTGTLRLALTDAPSCGYDAVNITVQKVRVNQSASAGDSDAGWVDITLPTAQKIDLLSLTNGVLFELGQTPLPAGHYTQLRLILADNGVTPLANSVVPTGGTETALTTPSAQQSGLKLDTDITVAADQLADFVLDFDACKSVVQRGNSGQYNLKPVISVIPRLSDAGQRIVGYVAPSIALATTTVSAQAGGVTVKSTVPDPATGQFTLYPVPAGSYDLVVSAAGRATAVLTGVPVVTTAYTVLNAAGAPILPPVLALAPRAVSGTVTPPTATVRATQLLSGGSTVEVAWAPVDAMSGAFAFSLAQDAPVTSAYAANAAIVFAPDNTAAAHYTIEAASSGVVKSQVIDAGAAVAPLTFTFP